MSNALPRPELRLTTDQVQAGSVVIAQAVGNDPGTADVVTFVWQVWFGPAIGAPLASSTGDNFSFTPTFNGFYRIRLTAGDEDGGSSTITVVSLVGTANDDTRVITAADLVGVDALIYQGLAGNDTISVAPYGLGGNDTLVGGLGDDSLVGGDGRDLLIGGFGAD